MPPLKRLEDLRARIGVLALSCLNQEEFLCMAFRSNVRATWRKRPTHGKRFFPLSRSHDFIERSCAVRREMLRSKGDDIIYSVCLNSDTIIFTSIAMLVFHTGPDSKHTIGVKNTCNSAVYRQWRVKSQETHHPSI